MLISMTERTITTTGAGAAPAVPDAVDLRLAVSTEADSPAEALTECGTVQERILAVLGVTASAGQVSVQQQWDHDRQRQGRPTATSTVTARLPDLASAGAVVTAALAEGGKAVRLDQMRAAVTDPSEAEDLARRAAFAEALASAETLAALSGGRLGGVVTVLEGGGPGAWAPQVRRTSSNLASFQMAEGGQDVAVSVTVTWELTD